MYLSDVDIKKYIEKGIIKIEPPVQEIDYRQCGIRIHLSDIIYELSSSDDAVDLRHNLRSDTILKKFFKEFDLKKLNDSGNPYILEPGKIVLGTTVEKIKMPNYMVGVLNGRSTVARFGIANHITASLVDNMDTEEPKNFTLEISNCGSLKFVLYPDIPIGMLLFTILSSRTDILPSGQYADSEVIPNIKFTHEKKII